MTGFDLVHVMDLMNKGTSFDSLGKPREALTCYTEAERILKSRKGNGETKVAEFMLACNKAIAHDNLGDYQASISQWDQALKLADNLPASTRHASSLPLDKTSPLLGKALTLANMGDLEKAIKICKDVLSIQPENPVALARMGYLSLRAENYQEAIHWCSRALQKDKRDLHSLSNLGAALSGVGRLEDARAVLQQVLNIAPTHPPALYSMGTLLLHMDLPEQAIGYLKKAVTFNPTSSEAWNHLGIALLQSGQSGSRECFEQALKADTNNLAALGNLMGAIQSETSCSWEDAERQVVEFVNRVRRG